MRAIRYCSVGLTCLALASGCSSGVAVRPASDRHSRPTGQGWWDGWLCGTVVREHDLVALIRREPGEALHRLRATITPETATYEVFAIAELERRYGRLLERRQPRHALACYLDAAALAYAQFDLGVIPTATNSWVTNLVETYNQATLGTVRLWQRLPGGLASNQLVVADAVSFRLEAIPGDASSDPRHVEHWLAADDWQETGLHRRFRSDGLGARLIATRTNRQESALELHEPDEGIIQPGAAILRFRDGAGLTNGGPRQARLVFFNPLLTDTVAIGGHDWPLAADFTVPWATLLARTAPLFKTRWSGLVNPATSPRPHRLYLMQPYAPDRIPLILVHGLHSTPLTWKQLSNELMGDPEIRRHYQIWHYLYPTGLPFLTSAADFRDDLDEMRHLLDPADHDFATHHMVVIGHSMGGLLARTLVTDSGDAIWDSTFAVPSSGLQGAPEQVNELRRVFYFEPKPYVRRVIFVAVPHRGSKLATGMIGRIVSDRVHLPDRLNQFVAELRISNPGLLQPEAASEFARGYPNSIDVLAPRNPGLRALSRLPVSPAIPFHSIIGDRGRGGGSRGSDGVVPYSSAHLEGASSELIVPAGHHAHDCPEAVGEIKRILKLQVAPQPRELQEASGDPP